MAADPTAGCGRSTPACAGSADRCGKRVRYGAARAGAASFLRLPATEGPGRAHRMGAVGQRRGTRRPVSPVSPVYPLSLASQGDICSSSELVFFVEELGLFRGPSGGRPDLGTTVPGW
jgi:hypothetical protein